MAVDGAKLDRVLNEVGRPNIPEVLAAAERERQTVRDRFPLAEWPNLPLERYALGTGAAEPTYCAMLEYHSNNLGGIRGGSASKHIIYRQRDGQWWLPGSLQALTPEEAWQRLRTQFVAAFDAVATGDFDALDDLNLLRHGQTLVNKSLSVYFPDRFVPISGSGHLRHFIRLFGGEAEDGAGAWRLNRQLRELVRQHAVLRDWAPIEVMRLLYDRFAPAASGAMPWKIAPGERGRMWESCRDGGYICVGWGEVGDLSQYPTKEDLTQRLQELPVEVRGGQPARVAGELLRLRDLEPGTRVLANRGTSEVLAVGTVTSAGYSFVLEQEYPHRVGVDWDTSYAQTLESAQNGWRSTFAPVNQQLWAVIQRNRHGAGVSTSVAEEPEMVRRVCAVLERKGQVILYGPPGTGKTRLALDAALAMTGDVEALTAPREQRRVRIEAMLNPVAQPIGPSVWLFVADPKVWSWGNLQRDGHVNYRRGRVDKHYERMRPGDLVVGYEATPVKKVVALARIDSVDLTKPEPVRLRWVRDLDGPSYEEWRTDAILAASEPALHRMQGTAFRLSAEEATLILGDDAPAARTDTDDDVPVVSMLTFHPSYGYEDFVESFKPIPTPSGALTLRRTDGYFLRLCKAAAAHPDRPYLLIIDEINRADLPRVLGELITLLEPDKRGVPVVLPVSGDTFRIPPNVRIIGTMNTADRSVAHLDAAVRRRFGFVPVPPNADVLTGSVGPLDLGRLLAAINERITTHLDADHALGHSFLLRDDTPVGAEEDLHAAWYDEVIPLLEDYSIGDAGVLAALLGKELVDRHTGRVSMLAPNDLIAALATEFSAALADDVSDA